MNHSKSMNATETTINTTVATLGSKATTFGAGTTFAAWVTSNEFLGVAGLVVAAIGLVVNIYFKRKEDQRQQREHDARMTELLGAMSGK